jgi:hypothetical protein
MESHGFVVRSIAHASAGREIKARSGPRGPAPGRQGRVSAQITDKFSALENGRMSIRTIAFTVGFGSR